MNKIWNPLFLRLGLPLALVMAAALMARAYDTTWIAAGEKLSAMKLKANLDEIQQRLEDTEKRHAGLADCPVGYTRDANEMKYVVCKKGADEIVKVGNGPSAFWIDRYEASVWERADGTGKQYGAAADDYPATFPRNAQRRPGFVDLYAVSKADVQPSWYLTWFQAQQACRASGKRLPFDEEWLAAATGTSDPGAVNGLVMGETRCNTQSTGKRNTGGGTTCASAWGAQDMVGNVWEWTANWYAGLSTNGQNVEWGKDGGGLWAADYNADHVWNVAGSTMSHGLYRSGIPAAAVRGGTWDEGTRAGVFALAVYIAPSNWFNGVGFRCVTP